MSPARFLALCLVAGAELPPSPPASIPGELLCELDGITTNAEPDLYDILVAAGVSVYRENAHWLQLIRRADPNATLFVDVGVNKGYFIAEVFARWRPSAGLTPQTLFQAERRLLRRRARRREGGVALRHARRVRQRREPVLRAPAPPPRARAPLRRPRDGAFRGGVVSAGCARAQRAASWPSLSARA